MPRTVLVADDNLTIQRMASEMLANDGVEVVTVANGVAAIKKIPDAKPLVILADVDMPGKDGYEVCDFVKNTPELHYVRVLLAVSDADPYDKQRGDRVHADGIIKKPFEREQLVSMVTECLNQAEAQRPALPPLVEPPPHAAITPEISAAPSEPEPQKAHPVEPPLAAAGSPSEPGTHQPFEPAEDSVDKPVSEPSWSTSQFSSAVDFAEPQRAESEDSSPAPAFEPLAPSETWASDVVWAPPVDDPPVPAARDSEPGHQASSFASLPATGPLDSEMPPAAHSGATPGEGLGTALGDESRFEQLVESLLVDGSAARPAAPPLETQDHEQTLPPDASASDPPTPSTLEGIEWTELEQAAEARITLDVGAVAQIVRSVVAKMAPPALAPDALHELETRIIADLLSDLKLS